MNSQRGFSLIELIVVLTLLSVISVIGTRFIVQSAEIYSAQANRAQLIASARQATERMVRQIRTALPNSLRISASGNCIEFVPVIGASYYLGQVSDVANGAPATASITTTPFSIEAPAVGTATYASIGSGAPGEIYAGSPQSIVGIASLSPSSNTTTLNFSSAHQFARNSILNRVFITESPQRFCVSGTTLWFYENYGVPSGSLTDAAPAGSAERLLTNVDMLGETPFAMTPGSQTQNSLVSMIIAASIDGERVAIRQEALLRNVP